MAPRLVVTQPARAVGRGRKIVEPPVALAARARGLEVGLVANVKTEGFHQRVRAFEPWAGVVVAFGQIFPSTLLDIPTEGCINLHASLLPMYRGAAPIQAAIAAGDEATGVTSMRMEAGLDSGPILLQEEIAIGSVETTPDLSSRLADLGARVIVETLRQLAVDGIEERQQNHDDATFAPKLSRDDGHVDWRLTARQIFNRWRAYTPWPGSVARLGGNPVKITRCRAATRQTVEDSPGTVVVAEGDDLRVACGAGSVLRLESLQRPGRAAVEAREFINGERLARGARFEVEPAP